MPPRLSAAAAANAPVACGCRIAADDGALIRLYEVPLLRYQQHITARAPRWADIGDNYQDR